MRIARDRDATGRAQNARPRDALGRPLPHGSTGAMRIPDDLRLAPATALREAQRLLDHELPFHAHEVLEGAWKQAEAEERELWQGLAQLAVGLTHVRRGNLRGAVTLISRARKRLAGYAGAAPHRVDVDGLLAWSDAALHTLSVQLGDLDATPAVSPGAIAVPRLRSPLPEPPGGEQVCLLARVCPRCGGVDDDPGLICLQCGAVAPG